MLEIEKLRQDMLIQDQRFEIEMKRLKHDMRKEGWQLIIVSIAGAVTFLVLSMAFGKLFFGG